MSEEASTLPPLDRDVDVELEVPSLPPPTRLDAGKEVDHFRVLRLLGRGGMGEVYLARDTKLGRRVALKLLRTSDGTSAEEVAAFLDEARATARFNHPHIVTIYAVGEYHGSPYLALEYLEGEDLRARMVERRLSLAESLRIIASVADALEEAHRHGVLHLDLKPENIVMAKDGRPRVVDFGLAKITRSQDSRGSLRPPSYQSTEIKHELKPAIAGTPAYMAPEQWHCLATSDKTDVWALGIMLFELCTGTRPYAEHEIDTTFHLALNVCSDSPAPRPELLAPQLNVEVAELIARCLKKVADERPDAATVARELRAAFQRDPVSSAVRESPFRGLLPFSEEHASFFFGREPELAALIERVRVQPVLPVVGPSGTGKSSFVHAGLVPRLREQGKWSVLRIRPGARPFEALAMRLRRNKDSRRGHASVDPSVIDDLATSLRETPGKLALELRAIVDREQANVLLVVDQLEEIVTMVDDEQVRRRFLEAVCRAADDADEPVRVVLTIRDDYLGRMALGPEAAAALAQVTVLRPLEHTSLAEVLVGPLRVVGYRFEDDALVEEMVAAVSGERAALPLLQFTALQLWGRRDAERCLLLRSVYEELGGVEGALVQHAEGVLAGSSASERAVVRAVLVRLVTRERTRKMVAQTELVRDLTHEHGAAEVEAAIVRLTGARLVAIRGGQRAGTAEAVLELAHESLIQRWETLAQWVDEAREETALLGEIGQAAELWERRGRRDDELWQDDALADVQRACARLGLALPERAAAFLAAATARQKGRRRRQRAVRASIMLALALVAALLGYQERKADHQRRQAQAREHEAQRERARADEQRIEALRAAAVSDHVSGRLLEARARLRTVLEQEDSTLARALWWTLHDEPLVWRSVLGAVVYDADLSPDGKLVAAASQNGAVYLFDAATQRLRVMRGHAEQALSVAFSRDGTLLASSGIDGEVRIWDVATAQAKAVLGKHRGAAVGLAFGRDGMLASAGKTDGEVRVWDVSSGKPIRTFVAGEGALGTSFSPDGTILAAANRDKTARLFDVASGRELMVLRGHEQAVDAVAFSPSGELVATGSSDRTVRLWRAASGTLEKTFEGSRDQVVGVGFSPDGRRIAAASYDGSVVLWDASTATVDVKLSGHEGSATAVGFAASGALMVSAGLDKTVRLWNVARAMNAAPAPHAGGTYGVGFTRDGRRLASGGGTAECCCGTWRPASNWPSSKATPPWCKA
jgi:serine/threonine protein kinase/WD40 repeat protein